MINLLQLEPLVFPDYAIFSNYDYGYADLPKRLWLCVKAESSNIYLFIVSLLNVIIKRQTSRYLVGYLLVKFTKALLEN
jgi:hypothetical protein